MNNRLTCGGHAWQDERMTTTQATTFRTYELFEIHWERGSQWTGYHTRDEAQSVVDSAAKRGDVGHVVRRTFEIELDPRFVARGMYQPGVSDRIV